MKEFDFVRLLALIQSLSFLRATLMWRPVFTRSLEPVDSSGPSSLLDSVFGSKLAKKVAETNERHAKALEDNEQTMRESVKIALDTAEEELQKLGLGLTLAEVARVKARFEMTSKLPAQEELDDISRRLLDEAGQGRFFSVGFQKASYLKEDLFGADIRGKYPSTAFEIDEAAKCLAMGRATASVFHLMRIMEIVVRATARCLNVPDPTRPMDRNWGSMFSAIKDGMDAKWSTGASRMSGDGQYFDGLLASLEAVKNPWRNSTMHVEKTYTIEEAERIWHAVEGLMITAAKRFDEAGEPKVP